MAEEMLTRSACCTDLRGLDFIPRTPVKVGVGASAPNPSKPGSPMRDPASKPKEICLQKNHTLVCLHTNTPTHNTHQINLGKPHNMRSRALSTQTLVFQPFVTTF